MHSINNKVQEGQAHAAYCSLLIVHCSLFIDFVFDRGASPLGSFFLLTEEATYPTGPTT